MTTDPESGVRILGGPLPYADGAEDELLEIMLGADDRSTGSDELVRHIHDWPTLYHLSRRRANLLRPLRFPPGCRVLDIGAGTGVASRALGEAGCEVVALEGSLARARVAAARCAGLSNVEVLCGTPGDLDDADGFDVVLLVGVLEYSDADIGGAGGPRALLDRAARLLRPGGALVVAIENQLGLKYLLGYAEDHLGEPFAGVEGYRSPGGIRTWSRAALRGLLQGAGFAEQRWLFPFPDYKLPVTVLSEAAYEATDAVEFIDQWVRAPVRDHANAPSLLCDDRSAHRTMLDAGFGPDVSNSFLVVASSAPAAINALVDADVVAWRFGEDRTRLWARETEVRASHDGWTVHRERTWPEEGRAERGWLRQRDAEVVPYLQGRTMEQEFLDAVADADLERAKGLLSAWRSVLDEVTQKAVDRAAVDAHPFLPASAITMLPATHLDVALDNLVIRDGEPAVLVDDEWDVPEGVERDLVEVRALWSMAQRLVLGGHAHPWSPEVTIDELCQQLGALCDRPIDDDLLERWRTAEALLQAKVSGDEPEGTAANLVEVGKRSRATSGVARSLPWTALRRETARLRVETATVRAELDRALEHAAEAEHLERELAAAHRLIDELSGRPMDQVVIADEVYHELEQLRAWRDHVQNRFPIKQYLDTKRRLGMIR